MTLASLRKCLPTAAWAPLTDPGSSLSVTLLSDAFKDEKAGTAGDQIDVGLLKIYALMHCNSKPHDKAVAFYNILQEGGLEAHE